MMLRSKRDVDLHVEQLEAKILSETERNLKAFSIAKLYYGVGDYQSAKTFVERYLVVRTNSAGAYRLKGQVLEAMQQRENALESFRKAYQIDPGMKEVVPKIAELVVADAVGNPDFDVNRAKHWLDECCKHYPRHKVVSELRKLLHASDEGHDVSGVEDIAPTNGANGRRSDDHTSSETSPGDYARPNLEDSLLWTAGNSSLLNGSRREHRGSGIMGLNSTPRVDSAGTPRRFAPGPSPERLSAQVSSLETTQEKLVELVLSQNKALTDELKAHSNHVLEEMRHQRISLVEELRAHNNRAIDEMKNNKQNVMDLRMEMKQGMHDIRMEVSRLTQVVKEKDVGDIKDILAKLPRQFAEAMPALPPQSTTAAAPASSHSSQAAANLQGIRLAELQEALAHQTTMLQMSNLGFAGMLTAPRPQGPGQVAQPHPPHNIVPLPPQSIVGSHFVPSPVAPVIPVTPEVPLPRTPVAPTRTPLAPASLTSVTPPSANRLHDYHIRVPGNMPPVTTSPFKEQEGPAVPITTTSLLSTIPSPAYSSLSKSPQATVNTATVTTASHQPAPPKAQTDNLMDKFKPKAGSWECGGCMLRNEEGTIQCKACETPKPGHEEEVKKKQEAAKPKVSFGAQGGFKFGIPATTTTTTTTTTSKPSPFGGFSFGVKPAGEAGTGGGFAFKVPPKEEDVGGHLSFENQGMKLNTAADAQEVADKIASAKNMKELTLCGNTIGIDAAKAIGKSLEKHSEFERAHWKDIFTTRAKTEIPPALKNLSHGILLANARLVELDLSDNAFGPIGMEGIVDLLKSPCCYPLQELRLNNTGCGVTGGKLLAKTLLECYHSSKKAGKPLALKVFVLGRSRQENEGAKALAEVFKLMGSLEEVIMPQNGIYHEGIKALADAFSHCPNLHSLNMNDNTFTEIGAGYLAKALPKLQKLTYLNLGDCLLKTEGAKLIANALKAGHNELEELHLDSNEVKIDGGEAIVDAVLNKPKMKKLYIGTNCFGTNGCESLLEKLGDKKTLVNGEIEDDEGSSDEDEEDDDENENEENEEETPTDKPDTAKGVATIGSAFSFQPSPGSANSVPLFGGAKSSNPSASTSIFGSASQSIFGSAKKDEQKPSTSIFGSGAPVFGSASQSIFGSAKKEEEKAPEKSTFNMSGGSDMPTFGALAEKGTGFSFGAKSESDSFAFKGAGSLLFGAGAKASPQKNDSNNDDDTVEDNDHDPHFEPIIPLPELVKVTTGEEDEVEIFKHRGKVYRYDIDTKQWKERGVGDVKILKHPTKNTFRVLLRREQIHKIACNHLISADMALKPMYGSETAVCWFAVDYADEEPKNEHLAVRFKLVETKEKFQNVFEDCQKQLKERPKNADSPQKVETAPAKPEEPKKDASPAKPFFSFGGVSQTTPQKDTSASAGNDDDVVEDNDHDPHFEPIIPLPELVQVTTGEEEEEEIFKHRGKVYRYDIDTKQWKERGVGDLKILKHKARNTFRVLLRREQILKIACNHLIAPEMVLKPMAGSETALCWFAIDYADEEPKNEHLAARFKLAETKDEFKKVFEDCQQQLREAAGKSPTKAGESPATPQRDDKAEAEEDHDEDYDEDGDDDDEDEENIMFEREGKMFEIKDDKSTSPLGDHVEIRIVYDDDVYGARILATNYDQSDDGEQVCNHLIAIQTELTSDDLTCSWSALDFSRDPPKYRKFKAVFSNPEDLQEFKDTFNEGKELADQSEILELPPGEGDPRTYYYGDGADYDA